MELLSRLILRTAWAGLFASNPNSTAVPDLLFQQQSSEAMVWISGPVLAMQCVLQSDRRSRAALFE
jgi:hypothetical protein